MVDPVLVVIGAVAASAVSGFITSVIGWLRTDEPFESRKNVSTMLAAVVLSIPIATAFLVANSAMLEPETPASTILINILIMAFASAGNGQIARHAMHAATKKKENTTELPKIKADDSDLIGIE